MKVKRSERESDIGEANIHMLEMKMDTCFGSFEAKEKKKHDTKKLIVAISLWMKGKKNEI